MTRAAGVAGAVHAGPVTPAAAALFNFQIAGTPTFLALDAAGRVTRVLPGYPGREAMAPWLRVMAGEADAL
jgi:thioredoxin-related protein